MSQSDQRNQGKSASGFPLTFANFAPVLFVCLWATGFIGGKLGLPYAEPLTFLLLRFIAVLVILIPLSLILKAPWPKEFKEWKHTAIAGLLVHGGYLGGVFGAIHHGMQAGVIALIVGLQPVLTAILAAGWMGDKVTLRQWVGLALGFLGVAVVVSGKLGLGTMNIYSMMLAVMALISITAGTLYQKQYCGNIHLLSGTAIQYTACMAVYLILAPTLENMDVQWTGKFVFALSWLVVVLSIISILLLYFLIRRGAATQVTSLFYMVPPTTAIMAWLIFGESFTGTGLVGMLICAVGVSLVSMSTRPVKP
jgi:drug/metabolite transporter (DMT)-like permease